jgi:hypothetical protein
MGTDRSWACPRLETKRRRASIFAGLKAESGNGTLTDKLVEFLRQVSRMFGIIPTTKDKRIVERESHADRRI